MKLGLLVVAALALLAAASTAEAARQKAPCLVQGARTIEAGVSGRVYFRPTRDPDRVYFCSYRTGRRTAIGWDDCFNAPAVGEVRFARRFLAVGYASCGPGGQSAWIDVRGARDGRRLRRLAAAPDVDRAGPTIATVTDLVVDRDGAVAWIVVVSDESGAEREIQVRGSVGGRRSVLLTSDGTVEPGSLALAGSRLYWTEAGQPRSAELR